MRPTPNDRVERFRLLVHPLMASTQADGNNGVFTLPNPRGSSHPDLVCIVSDGRDAKECGVSPWEHVSARAGMRCPTWEEMHFVKEQFWQDEECVMQLHPVKSQYKNLHPAVLHLWRPLNATIPTPDLVMV